MLAYINSAFRFLLIFAIFMGFSHRSIAGSVTAGEIISIQTGFALSKILIEFDTTISGKPSCANDGTNRMVLNPSTEIGKSILSVALTAMTTAMPVDVIGNNDCGEVGGLETIMQITIKK